MTLGTSPERKITNWNVSSVKCGANATEVESFATSTVPFGTTATAHTAHILVAKTIKPRPPLGAWALGARQMWSLYINERKVMESDNRNICVEHFSIYTKTSEVDYNAKTLTGYFWDKNKQDYLLKTVSWDIVRQ
jgi:hypothetical protein